MTRGRKPKPTELKKLAGNPGKRPLNRNEPKPGDKSKPTCPRYLGKTAKREWRRIAGELYEMGILTKIDQTMLAAYCQAFGRWVDAAEQLETTGGEILVSSNGNLYQNPWLAIVNRSMEQMAKLAAEFGLSPSARSRLNVKPGRTEPTLADLLMGAPVTVSDE